MNYSNGYKQWQELFDENVSQVWKDEPVPVLKTISMMSFSINREIKKIQDALQSDILLLRNSIEESMMTPVTDSQSNSEIDQVHTEEPKRLLVPHKAAELSDDLQSQLSKLTTPFKAASSHDESGSIVISDDDVNSSERINTSPEIKKKNRHDFKRKFRRKRKLNDGSLPTDRFLKPLDNGHFKENHQENRQSDTLVRSNSYDFLMDLVGTSEPEKANENNSPNICLKTDTNACTPQKPDSDLDFSVVQCTPDSRIMVPNKQDKLPTHLKKKKTKHSTLTQMFSKRSNIKDKPSSSRFAFKNYDSDETNVSVSVKPMDSKSTMEITKMVSYINKESRMENTEMSDVPDEISELISSVRFEDFEDDTPLNSAILEENNSAIQAQNVSQQALNEFLAQAQNVPNQLEAEPIIRGKARQKLPGWSCGECEKFYLKQGLNPDQILALTENCSKHRGFYRPREDTIPGFWDMNVATQDTENT